MDLVRFLGLNGLRGPWGLKKVLVVGVILVGAFSIFLARGQRKKLILSQSRGCRFPAVYNFGDSNSDTGGRSAAFTRTHSPYGITFFGKPSGRLSDGHLMIDFMVDKLDLPYLHAYLDSIGSNFRYGANFATGGSTIQPINGRMFEARLSPFSLDIQLLQFQQFKSRTNELFSQGIKSEIKGSLPRPEDFSEALYTLDIGQNDLYDALRLMTLEQVQASISNITQKLASAVERLYQQGARKFWIHNTGPIGCLPVTVVYNPPKPEDMDDNGCLKSHNEVAQEFNRQLKERVSNLRSQLLDTVLTYVDIYAAKYKLISEAEKHGFTNPLGYCCGHYGSYVVYCGMTTLVNGSEVYGASCTDPSEYISWDGMHYTHAANQWVANHILDGSFSDPPISITQACHKHPPHSS
ncbi:Lipase [Parasponia andersonii]|uniref:Lipase n=1 Tax=Parasponia andersonii TaxID=3476 RepID=A0A2P5CT95_PARAD|nr:Lipase [Parasponia andersonii]